MLFLIIRFLYLVVVRMNGVVKTDETDSVAGDMTASTAAKPGSESAVIQPPGIGPAIHLNGSACPPVQDDQPVQVCQISNDFLNQAIVNLSSFKLFRHICTCDLKHILNKYVLRI